MTNEIKYIKVNREKYSANYDAIFSKKTPIENGCQYCNGKGFYTTFDCAVVNCPICNPEKFKVDTK